MHSDAVRIIDANLNRAREALRVIEDYARFTTADADAAGAAKQARHDLRAIAALLDAETRLTHRDVEGDIGRELTTAQELTRSSAEDVVAAAFGRLTEASRSLAEFGKLLDPQLAALGDALRFRAYALEQRVVLRGELHRQFRACRLYVLVTESQCRADWLAVATSVVRSGPLLLQLREKSLSDRELLRRARVLRELTRERGGLFIVNDRPDIARLAGADGVHVGQDDLSVSEARTIGGARLLVGKSTHTIEQVDAAITEAPDYLAIGPMFPSTTKPQDHVPGPALLAEAARRTSLPLVAIGGIGPQHANALYRAGASSVCVCSSVLGVVDPGAAVRSFLDIAATQPRNRVNEA